MAAKPLLRDGKNLQINALWESALGADYDGDAMQVHLPVSQEAIKDAYRMMPSNNVFSDKKRNDLMRMPKNEVPVGFYKATRNIGLPQTGMVHRYRTVDEAWKDYYSGKLKMTDYVEIG